MSPRTKKQFENIRQEKREIILDTALEVFATHGYHGSSISTIAKHAGISKGLLYNYFESKEELLKVIVNEGFKEFMDIINPFQNENFTDEMLTPEAFRKLFKNIFEIMKSNLHFWRLYYAMALQPGVMEMILNDYENNLFSYLDLLEKYYKKQGSKKPRADAMHTYIMIDGLTINYIQPHKEFSIEELEDSIIIGLETPLYK